MFLLETSVTCILKKSFPSFPFPWSHKHLEDRDSDMITQYSAWIIGGTYTLILSEKINVSIWKVESVLSFHLGVFSLFVTDHQTVI